jgi:hypothetical protein
MKVSNTRQEKGDLLIQVLLYLPTCVNVLYIYVTVNLYNQELCIITDIFRNYV